MVHIVQLSNIHTQDPSEAFWPCWLYALHREIPIALAETLQNIIPKFSAELQKFQYRNNKVETSKVAAFQLLDPIAFN